MDPFDTDDISLSDLHDMFQRLGVKKLFAKQLSANDNSKNQVYLGGDFSVLQEIPLSILTSVKSESKKEKACTIMHAELDFSWVDRIGAVYPASNTKLILYPQYPEVRFSGFLAGCVRRPSLLMNARIPGRILFLGVTEDSRILGFVVSPDSRIASELTIPDNGANMPALFAVPLPGTATDDEKIFSELLRIHQKGWINSRRLTPTGNSVTCNASNCGGYTLEAELGICPNGSSEPDYLGWEVKQFASPNLKVGGSARITLMTPEPDGGLYKEQGPKAFVERFGHPEKKGRPNRFYFSGTHMASTYHKNTGLQIVLPDYNIETGKLMNSSKGVLLLDSEETVAASWSYSGLLAHWAKKHAKAVYIPSERQADPRCYRFGGRIGVGRTTDFHLFLSAFATGKVVYDPGISLHIGHEKIKCHRRNQFRIKAGDLEMLYHSFEIRVLG